MTEQPKTAGVIAPPPLLLLASLIVGIWASQVAPLDGLARIAPLARYVIGGVLIGLALTIGLSAVFKFRDGGTAVNPYVPPTALMTDGVFARVRNPMYMQFYFFSVGLALILAADWLIVTTVVLALIIHYGVVLREERFLEARFGEAYLRYKAQTPRYGWKF